MSSYSRNELWKASFKTYYNAYFQELVAKLLVSRWQVLDGFTKVLVALTATGSVVSGWALWSEPYLKTVWGVLAGSAALA